MINTIRNHVKKNQLEAGEGKSELGTWDFGQD